MFQKDSINISGLPPKTLCLTYDDGPGPHSLEIGKFLNSHGIRATFFVVGKFAEHRRDILKELADLGHILGNHTYEHPDLPYYCSINGDVQDQIIRTDVLIREYNRNNKLFFRAPYGKWSPEVAVELNRNIKSAIDHFGPLHWDIAGIDCHYWRIGKSVDEAVNKYLEDINIVGRGIVVMHDEIADMDHVQVLNRTHELTRELIPKLLALGYTFIALDEIDEVKQMVSKPEIFAMSAGNKKFLQSQGDKFIAGATDMALKDCGFQMINKGFGKVCFMNSDGKYMFCNPDSDKMVSAIAEYHETYSVFHLIPVRDNVFILRSYNGNYLTASKDNTFMLAADAPFMRQAGIFKFRPLDSGPEKKISWAKQLQLLKKRLLFIKSKILQQS